MIMEGTWGAHRRHCVGRPDKRVENGPKGVLGVRESGGERNVMGMQLLDGVFAEAIVRIVGVDTSLDLLNWR